MKLFLSALIFSIVAPLTLQAQPAPDTAELTKLLNEFLAGASRNDAAMHDRFWADDLIYTGSGGRRRGKADVMRDVASAPAPKPGDPRTTYTAEEVRIQQYGDTAIVAFRLVGTTEKDGTIQVSKFLNSGTFLKRNGKWQVVNWQATRIPRPEADARKDLATAEAAFQRAALSGDLKTLESLLDQNFVWMHGLGEQVTRQQYLDDVTNAVAGHEPRRVVELLDLLLVHFHTEVTATLCLAVLDVHTGEMEVVNAGHLPPLVISPRRGRGKPWFPDRGVLLRRVT